MHMSKRRKLLIFKLIVMILVFAYIFHPVYTGKTDIRNLNDPFMFWGMATMMAIVLIAWGYHWKTADDRNKKDYKKKRKKAQWIFFTIILLSIIIITVGRWFYLY